MQQPLLFPTGLRPTQLHGTLKQCLAAFKKLLKKPVFPGLYIRGPGDDPNELENHTQTT